MMHSIEESLAVITYLIAVSTAIWQVSRKVARIARSRGRNKAKAPATSNAVETHSIAETASSRRGSFETFRFGFSVIFFFLSIIILIVLQYMPILHPLSRADVAMIGLNVVNAIVCYHLMNYSG